MTTEHKKDQDPDYRMTIVSSGNNIMAVPDRYWGTRFVNRTLLIKRRGGKMPIRIRRRIKPPLNRP